MNQVILTGNLCRDIELRQLQDGGFVGSSSLAVRRDRKNANGEYETDFFDVKFFGKQAEFASKYLRKGNKIGVSGSVQIRDYVNKQGVKGKAIEVLVNSVENLEPKAEDSDAPIQEQPETQAPAGQNLQEVDIPDDDLPF